MIGAKDTVVDRVSAIVQCELVCQVRDICKASPLVRPRTTGDTPMRVRVTSAGDFGFVGDGAYRYARKDQAGNPWPAIPPLWRNIASDVAGEYPWDCAIINWYDEDAALGWHRDMSERDRTLPIVTISLGDAASWAVRADERSPITRQTIETGDVTLLAGVQRNWLHTIERIVPEPLFSPLAKRGRISITMRVAG